MPRHATDNGLPDPTAFANAGTGLPTNLAPVEDDDWTSLVLHQLLVPLADRLDTRQIGVQRLTQSWARTLAEAGFQAHELGGIRQALLQREAGTFHPALRRADAVATMHRLRRNGQALAALPRRGARYPQQTRQRRLTALYTHLSMRARRQNAILFTERRGKLWCNRLAQALDRAARRIAEKETLIAGLDDFTPAPQADTVDAVLLSDGWHFSIRAETLADWRRRLPRLA